MVCMSLDEALLRGSNSGLLEEADETVSDELCGLHSFGRAADAVHHRVDVAAPGGRYFRMARPQHDRAILVGVAPRGQHMHGSGGDHCCGRAASGRAAAPPTSVKTSRRPDRSNGIRTPTRQELTAEVS
jgi:hypothetical protein